MNEKVGRPCSGRIRDHLDRGFDALWNNTTGLFNTAQGTVALYNNTTGKQNTAVGVNALFENTTGSIREF